MPRKDNLARLLLTFAGCAAVLGCDKDHSRALDQSAQTLNSWSASLDFADGQFQSHTVPGLYLRQFLRAADESLDSRQKTIAKAPQDDPRRHQLEGQLNGLRLRIRELSGRVES